MKIKFRKILVGLTSILALGIFMGGVSAENVGDINDGIDGGTGSGCEGKDSCWLYADGDVDHPVYGIRISIVDNNGNLVSKKAVDYLATKAWAYKVNNNKSYFRYADSNGGIVNRISLLLNPSSASLRAHNGSEIAKIWPTSLGTLPYMYDDTMDIASYIKNKIINLEEEQLISLFFNDLGYSVPNGSILENHYMIIEPLTMVSAFNKTKIFYGTYYELTKELIGTYNYQNSSNGKSWIASVLDMELPLSMYITGNEDIYGYNSSTGTYFNGKLKIAKDKYTWYQENKKRTRVKTDYVKDGTIGYGIGIIAMDKLKIERPTCDYNDASHFSTTTSGPGGIDCCEYVLENIDNYGILKSELFSKYPRCASAANANACAANISFSGASCNNKNSIKILDKFNWECIYESAYSNDENWRTYFLEYGDINESCSISCEYEVNFEYPWGTIKALAGNRFSISDISSPYTIDTKTSTVNPATLGPIKSTVEKHCAISGNRNDCVDNVYNLFPTEIAPELYFEYNSTKYDTNMKLDKVTTLTKEYNGDRSFLREWTTYYQLPYDTYKYVSKYNGFSFKDLNDPLTLYPYDSIGPHAPIHFSDIGKTDYTITINKFNIDNFDKYIKNGTQIASKYETSIETYIKRLIELGELKLKSINGIYYFSDSFTKLLENPQSKTASLDFSINNFLSMSCANTSTYSCSSDDNGIYCLNKGTNQNNEDTYTNAFKSCIDNYVENINYELTDFKQSLDYTCDFEAVAGKGNPTVNVIFRPISLNNPFPGKDGLGREVGVNWGHGEDYTADNETIRKIIKNNRDVETDKIYRELDPLYKITLTPSLIKQIREYNKKNTYDDIKNLKCNSNGEKCTSQFIRDKFATHFTGCGITNASVGLTCQDYDKWNTIDY